jgi:hypothetical protein
VALIINESNWSYTGSPIDILLAVVILESRLHLTCVELGGISVVHSCVGACDNSSREMSIAGLMASHMGSDKIEIKIIINISFIEGLFNVSLIHDQVITFRACEYCD